MRAPRNFQRQNKNRINLLCDEVKFDKFDRDFDFEIVRPRGFSRASQVTRVSVMIFRSLADAKNTSLSSLSSLKILSKANRICSDGRILSRCSIFYRNRRQRAIRSNLPLPVRRSQVCIEPTYASFGDSTFATSLA